MKTEDPDPALPEPAARGEDTLTPMASVHPPALSEPPPRLTRPSIAEMRRSILSLPLFNPRWKPWTPRRVVTTTLAFAACLLYTSPSPRD